MRRRVASRCLNGAFLAVAMVSLTQTAPAVAVPTAWQLLDDGDPSPGNWPMVFDSIRQRAVLETAGSLPVGGPDGPGIHWELVGNVDNFQSETDIDNNVLPKVK